MASSLESAPESPVPLGTILAGKYRVERVLGYGGMGVVVEARHLALDERVALKFLLSKHAQDAEKAERFLREARAAVKITSEHVARVRDVGTLETGAPYMVMELLDGSDLAKLIQSRGALHVTDAVDFIIQGCEAIAEAHSYGIVHRDLKPANLFLTRRRDGSPLVKVLDFGISKSMSAGVDSLTKTTEAIGSALYMSPEQMQQTRSVDHRTDIYAMGVALFELITGKFPFFADTIPHLCAQVLQGEPTPLRELRPDVPEHLAAAVARAYEREKDKRYQSIAELVCAIAPYAPPRSQAVIERIARAAGLEPPLAGRVSSPPEARAWQRGSDPPAASTSEPVNPESSGQILVPGYAGPVSVKASAAFAAGAYPPPVRKPSSAGTLLVFAGLGILAIIFVIVLIVVRGRTPAPRPEDAPSTQVGAQPAPTPAEPTITAPVVEPGPIVTAAPLVSSASPSASDAIAAPTGNAPPAVVSSTSGSARQPIFKPVKAPSTGASGTTKNVPPPVLTAR